MPASDDQALSFAPLTPERLADFETLFGPRGAVGGCWCMYWRLPGPVYEAGKGEPNRQAHRRLVEAGVVPGILAYAGDEAVGWCSFAPRADYLRLARSRNLKAVDDAPVWSIGCFFIRKDQRGRGLSLGLLCAAVETIAARGGRIIEGYPIDKAGEMPEVFAWTGFMDTYRRAGFVEVARRAETRPIMRLTLP
jgi:GNAT superfamily N-acetyltransferase